MNLLFRHKMLRSRTCKKKRSPSKRSWLHSSKSKKTKSSILRGKSKKRTNKNNSNPNLWRSKSQNLTPSNKVSNKSLKLLRLNNSNSKRRLKSYKTAWKRSQKNLINFHRMQIPTKRTTKSFKKRLNSWEQRTSLTLTSMKVSRKLLIKTSTVLIKKLLRLEERSSREIRSLGIRL